MNHPFSGGRPMSASEESTAPSLVQQEPATCPTCGRGEEYMRLTEVEKLLHVAHSTAWRWVVAEQKIPYFRPGKGTILVRRGDVKAFIESNRYGKAAS